MLGGRCITFIGALMECWTGNEERVWKWRSQWIINGEREYMVLIITLRERWLGSEERNSMALTSALMDCNRKWRERSCSFHKRLNGIR